MSMENKSRRLVRFIGKAGLVLGVLLGIWCFPMTAKAETYTFLNMVTFDYMKYADTYPDLKAIYGYDQNLLYQHWINCGSKENRVACLNRFAYLSYFNFDFDAYRENYPELAKKYGADDLSLWSHYITNGVKEGRICRSTDPYVDAIMRCMDAAAEIAKSCDGSVLVLEYNKTRIRGLQDAYQQMVRTGTPVLGCVLNKVAMDRLSTKKYYYKYGGKYGKYGYKYGYNREYARNSKKEK